MKNEFLGRQRTLSELVDAIANDPSGRSNRFLTKEEMKALEEKVASIILDTLLEPIRRELRALIREFETMAIPEIEKARRLEAKRRSIEQATMPGGDVFERAKTELIFFHGMHQEDGKRGLLQYLEKLRKQREDLGLEC